MNNSITRIFQESKKDPLLSQALARTVFSAVLLLTISIFEYLFEVSYLYPKIVVSLHMVYSLFSIYYSYRYPKDSHIRKMIGIFADLGALSLILYTADFKMIFVYPVYLWVIVGNGMRYGSYYLKMALSIGVVFFALATLLNPIWEMHRELAISLTIGIVVLGLFYATLIGKIYKLNSELEAKVQERTRQLEYQLFHDDLTGLKNRKALKTECSKEKCHELFLVDIDNFKNYNELYGMEIGNKILLETARVLKNIVSRHDGDVYRIYADGFALRFPALALSQNKEESCNLYILSILTELSDFAVAICDKEENLHIDFTVVAVYEQDRLLEKADMALRYAREKGQKYLVYDKRFDTKEQIETNLYWRENIRKAIVEDRIIAVFQPIVNRNGEIVKFESLMRMQLDGKLVAPFFFLDIAIKTHQYEQLTAIMVDKSFQMMQKVEKEFSINLSLSDINNKLTINHLIAKIKKHNIGSRLIIEILETEDSADFESVQQFVDEVRSLGVKIAIDDFGSGYSNFDHLFKLMPDFLKIDGSLIKKIDKDVNSYKLVESIVFLAKNLGIQTIAEYVHSKEVFEVCKVLGIDSYQGFYFYEPMQPDDLLAMDITTEEVVEIA